MASLTSDIDAGGAGDYATLGAALSGQARDLTDGGGDTWTGTTRSSDDSADGSSALANGWTTGATTWMKVIAAAGEEALKSSYSTTRYRLELTDDECLYTLESYISYVGIQCKPAYSAGTPYGLRVHSSTPAGTVDMDSCRIEGSGGGSGSIIGVRLGSGNVTANIYNNVLDNIGTFGVGNVGIFGGAGTANVYNNIIRDCGRGVENSSGATLIAKNNAVFDCTDDFVLLGTNTLDFNASDDGDGDHPIAPLDGDWDKEFVDSSNGDFTVLVDGNCKEGGVNDPGSGLFSVDIEGDTYVVDSWPVGVDQFVAPGGGASLSMPLSYYYRRRRRM